LTSHKKVNMAFFGTLAGKIVKVYLLLTLGFVVLYPLLYMISQAVRAWDDLYDPSVIWFPKNFSMDSFKTAFRVMDYPKTALNTALISLTATLLQLVSCSCAGYGFARFNFRFKRLFFALCLFSIVVPMQMIMIPSYMQMQSFNVLGIGFIIKLFTGSYPDIYNTPLAIFIPALLANGIRGSMYIFIFRQFFRGLPRDLEDASNIDGAGFLQTFLRVIVPLSGPPFLVVFLLSTLWYWNDGITVSFFFDSAQTIGARLVNIIGANAISGGEFTITQILAFQQAGALLTIAPPLILFLFLQRRFVESIDKTGLK